MWDGREVNLTGNLPLALGPIKEELPCVWEGVVTPGQLRTTPTWSRQLPTYLLADISSHSPPIGLAGFDRSVSVCIHILLGVLEL